MLNYIIVTKIGAACYGGIFAVMKQKFVTIVRPTHAKSASGKWRQWLFTVCKPERLIPMNNSSLRAKRGVTESPLLFPALCKEFPPVNFYFPEMLLSRLAA